MRIDDAASPSHALRRWIPACAGKTKFEGLRLDQRLTAATAFTTVSRLARFNAATQIRPVPMA